MLEEHQYFWFSNLSFLHMFQSNQWLLKNYKQLSLYFYHNQIMNRFLNNHQFVYLLFHHRLLFLFRLTLNYICDKKIMNFHLLLSIIHPYLSWKKYYLYVLIVLFLKQQGLYIINLLIFYYLIFDYLIPFLDVLGFFTW